jgi:hypothetical protein
MADLRLAVQPFRVQAESAKQIAEAFATPFFSLQIFSRALLHISFIYILSK